MSTTKQAILFFCILIAAVGPPLFVTVWLEMQHAFFDPLLLTAGTVFWLLILTSFIWRFGTFSEDDAAPPQA